MAEWFELTEQDRITTFYSKYTIQDFWLWWSDGNTNNYMEVRIRDYKLVVQIAKFLGLPYSICGIYVNNADDLKRVLKYTRDKTTIWFGIQPRKKNTNEWGEMKFGGKDSNVRGFKFLFVDIDRKIKNGEASNKDLQDCDIVANFLINRMNDAKWAKNYCKICSGNGVQLLFKLDEELLLPKLKFKCIEEYDKFRLRKVKKFYPETDEYFDILKNKLKQGIGAEMDKFVKQFKELNVMVDTSGFRLSGVGAIPFSKNFKYDGFRWRGVLEIKNEGKNEGLSDYIMSKEGLIRFTNNNNVFGKVLLAEENKIKKGVEFYNHPLVKLMLTCEFPEGYINNTLWFSMKILIRDCEIDTHSKEFIAFHTAIINKHKRSFSLNIPDKKFTFNPSVVNNYCIEHLIPPAFSLTNKNKFYNMCIGKIPFDCYKLEEEYKLSPETNIFTDISEFTYNLKENNITNNTKWVGQFINGCIKKYGMEKTKYYYDYLFKTLMQV